MNFPQVAILCLYLMSKKSILIAFWMSVANFLVIERALDSIMEDECGVEKALQSL